MRIVDAVSCIKYLHISAGIHSKSHKLEDVAQKTNNPDAKVMADTLSTAVGPGKQIKTRNRKWEKKTVKDLGSSR